MVLAVTLFAMNMFVLWQADFTNKWGIRCDQALKKEHRQRLPPPGKHVTNAIRGYVLILLVLFSSIITGLFLLEVMFFHARSFL